MVSFDSDHSGGDGASPLFFSPGQYLLFVSPLNFGLTAFVRWGREGLERIFFRDLANCGVAGHVPEVLLGILVHGG